MQLWVLIVGVLMTVVGLGLAGKRIVFLYRLITSGQPAPDRVQGVTSDIGAALKRQVVEVFGQKKLLKWSIPGAAHFFVFWAFLILGTVYVEAYGALLAREHAWHFLFFGTFKPLGFLQDFIAVMCLLGLVAFWQIRLKNSPAKLERKSRFFGSHLGGAYLVLFMIFNVIWTMFFFRGAVSAYEELHGEEGYGAAAFGSYAIGKLFGGLSESTLELMIGMGLLLHIGIMLVFLVDVVNSKHLHIFIAPLNVLFGRRPVALGAVKPLISDGKQITMDDLEDLDEDSKLGVGSIEDFTWKGLLDFSTCTECGRCQSQCPAWNTEKPLSPKLLIMAMRDHAFARGDYTLASESERERMLEGNDTLTKEVERPLVGDTGDDWFYMPENGAGVIDTDVLWSCVTCGACVDQCPVDIEHVDHIVDMRRYQVLVENNFPAELNQLFKGMENKGNPWNMSATARMDWAKDLPFDVKVVGAPTDQGGLESLESVDWLFWVGCAGAYEDRAKKTTRAVAELLDMAGVTFGVLGNGETCTGDSARRAGNEFVFQGLAQQNVETFKEFKVKKVVSTCAHCFNTLKNEYREFGIELEVVHHTQLLNRLVREGKLTPVTDGEGAHKRSITYHDPCYIGRHNGVYEPPRELLQVLPGAEYVEMERNSERSFCCGAGGARMWMEETIGTRINENRTNEAVATGADQIAVGCPFCRVMLSDGLTSAQSAGTAREEVEVLDVAQMLLASIKGKVATRHKPGEAPLDAPAQAKSGAGTGADATPEQAERAEAEAEVPAPAAKGGGSLFDDAPADEAPAAASTPPAAKSSGSLFDDAPSEDTNAEPAPAKPAASSGGSLFDLDADAPAAKSSGSLFDDAPSEDTNAEPAPAESAASSGGSLSDLDADAPAAKQEETPQSEPKAAETKADLGGSGGSLFDLGGDEPATKASSPAVEPEAKAPESKPESKPAATGAALGSGGSLFDIPASEAAPAKPAAKGDAKPEPEPEPEAEPVAESDSEQTETQPASALPDLGSGGSLFDIPAAEPTRATPAAKSADPAPDPDPETQSEPQSETQSAESESATAVEPEPKRPATSGPGTPRVEPTPEPAAAIPDLSGGGSLFDIPAAQTTPSPPNAKAAPEPEPKVQPQPETQLDATAGADAPTAAPDGAAVSTAATEAAQSAEDVTTAPEPEPQISTPADSAGDEVDTLVDPEPEPDPEKPKPTNSGAAHTPKTDVDIYSSGSLFDL